MREQGMDALVCGTMLIGSEVVGGRGGEANAMQTERAHLPDGEVR